MERYEMKEKRLIVEAVKLTEEKIDAVAAEIGDFCIRHDSHSLTVKMPGKMAPQNAYIGNYIVKGHFLPYEIWPSALFEGFFK